MGVNKADQWAADLEVPTVPNYRGRRANYRTGTATVGKRQTGVVEGVATPKRVQPGRRAARKVGGSTPTTVRINPGTMLPENPQMVGKANLNIFRGNAATGELIGQGRRAARRGIANGRLGRRAARRTNMASANNAFLEHQMNHMDRHLGHPLDGIGKADSERREKVRHARRVLVADPRFGVNPMNEQNKEWRRHWKTNAAGLAGGAAAGAGAGVGAAHLRGRSKLVGGIVGGLGGELVGATVARHKIIRRMEDSGHLKKSLSTGQKVGAGAAAGLIGYGASPQGRRAKRKGQVAGLAYRSNPEFRQLSWSQRRQVVDSMTSKRDRRYNPEAKRQRRVGVATAATGLAGAALLARGGHNIRRSTQLSRKGARFTPTAGRPANVVDVDGKKKLIMLPEGILQHGEDLHRHGITASRGELGQVGGGAALLGASGGLAHYGRSRSNREWR